jgi:hypothetical protein
LVEGLREGIAFDPNGPEAELRRDSQPVFQQSPAYSGADELGIDEQEGQLRFGGFSRQGVEARDAPGELGDRDPEPVELGGLKG